MLNEDTTDTEDKAPMNEDTETTPEDDSTEIGFTVAPTFRDMMAQRPQTEGPVGLPLKTVVNTLMMNGAASVYAECVAPIANGDLNFGSLQGNEAVIGLKVMEYDAAHDNLISTARVPKNAPKNKAGVRQITALMIGQKVREIVGQTYVFEKRSFTVSGLLTDR